MTREAFNKAEKLFAELDAIKSRVEITSNLYENIGKWALPNEMFSVMTRSKFSSVDGQCVQAPAELLLDYLRNVLEYYDRETARLKKEIDEL